MRYSPALRRSATPKVPAAEQRASDLARYNELARVAIVSMTNCPLDILAGFEAVRTVIGFAKHHEKVQAPTDFFLVRCQMWIEKNQAAYDDAVLAAAWASLPERLTKFADERGKQVEGLAAKIIEAKEKGYGLLQVLSWSHDAFKAAAEHDVAKRVAHDVTTLTERGTYGEDAKPLTPAIGFDLIEKHIEHECRRAGRGTGSSTSATSNIATDEERVAWFRLAEKVCHFRSIHSIW